MRDHFESAVGTAQFKVADSWEGTPPLRGFVFCALGYPILARSLRDGVDLLLLYTTYIEFAPNMSPRGVPLLPRGPAIAKTLTAQASYQLCRASKLDTKDSQQPPAATLTRRPPLSLAATDCHHPWSQIGNLRQ